MGEQQVTRRRLVTAGVLLGVGGTGLAAAAVPTVLDAATRAGRGASSATAEEWSEHDIRRHGAVSGQDCTAAIEATARTGALFIPKGQWRYGGAGLDWSVCQSVVGVGRGLSNITLEAGRHLFTGTAHSSRFRMADLTVQGGAGAMRLTSTGANVGAVGMITWERVDFFRYTGCAVGHAFRDAPNWTFRDCGFFADSDRGTIGIALSGDAAGSLIDHCSFGQNRCHVKIDSVNGGADVVVRFCDFVRSAPPGGSGVRADVWIVPAPDPHAPGNGAPALLSCKFGPENRAADDRAVLVAESTPSGFWADDLPAQRSGGELRGLRIVDCLYGALVPAPFATVTCAALTLLQIDRLTINGELPPALLQLTRPSELAQAIGQRYGSVTGLVNKDAAISTAVRLQNGGFPVAVTTQDARRTLAGVPEVNPNASLRTPGVRRLAAADATGALRAGAGNRVERAAGGREATVRGAARAGVFALYGWVPVRAAASGSWVHVELDVALAAGSAAVPLDVVLRDDRASARSRIRIDGASWTRHRVRLLAGGGASQLVLTAAAGSAAIRVRRVQVFEEPLA